MNPSNPTEPERPNRVLMALVILIALIPIAGCCFFFGGFYGLIALAAFFSVSAILCWFLRIRRRRGGDTDRQIDKAIVKSSDDPRQMALWVP
jgi:hypothetical protein